MKILSVVGARPQFIKSAPLSRAMRAEPGWKEVLVHTGQHFDHGMSEVFFQQLGLAQPDYNLGVNSRSAVQMTTRMMEGLEGVIQREKPDWVLVFGDTHSTLAGALAARKMNKRLVHVEAGLRSGDLNMPEELNRVVTDRISDLLLAPSEEAARQLLKEGLPEYAIYVVGDIMYDAILHYGVSLPRSPLAGQEYVLLTLHRAENTDNPERLKRLMQAIDELSERVKVVFPVHPRTRVALQQCGLSPRTEMIDPVGYLEMLALVKDSQLVLTDSGGLQKEAFYLNKFCISLRPVTEWQELHTLGVNAICDDSSARILKAYDKFRERSFPGDLPNPYGTGQSAERIVEAIRSTTP